MTSGTSERQVPKGERRVVRVIPDVLGINREFDYFVPEAWEADGRSERLATGSMVRVSLAGRRVAGWVSAVDVEPPAGVELAPLQTLSGVGPSAGMMELADWAAWRWAGSRVRFLRAASPPSMLAGVPRASSPAPVPSGPADVFSRAFEVAAQRGVAVVRTPPNSDDVPLALEACRRGDALLLLADSARARRLGIALRRAGVRVALGMQEWPVAASGSTVVGTRSAAWMPMPRLSAVVVFDEHDESLAEQSSPTWHAREVGLERARRSGVPAVLSSPVPSLEALRAGPLLRPDRDVAQAGWPRVEVFDRRADDPVKAGLFAEGIARVLRGEDRVVCVLNRKGRSRLMACASCGELVRTLDGASPMVLDHDELRSPDGTEVRPPVCAHCGHTRLKNLRAGVTRAREELEALVGEAVDEVTASSVEHPATRVVIGTEAVLHRVEEVDAVVFLDLDQEMLAPRQRAVEQTMALLARAARLSGPRGEGGRLVVQTRQPDHEVVRAVLRGDPAIVAVAERDRRSAAGVAPYGAQVLVSGAGAREFIAALGQPAGVRILGPSNDRWLLQADTHEPILNALADTPRPDSRLRIEVDPLRA